MLVMGGVVQVGVKVFNCIGGYQFEPISGGMSSMTRLCELDSVLISGGKTT